LIFAYHFSLFDLSSKEFVMHNRTKRALQSALISGGLLMLGTGIASAAENVNPDVPASPLDQLLPAPELTGLAETVAGATGNPTQPLLQAATDPDLRAPAQVLHSALSPATAQRPGPAPAAILHTVPMRLLQHEPAPIAELPGDVTEYDLNAPLGSELGATALPALPAVAPTSILPGRSTPVDAPLPIMVPLHGKVSAQPLTPAGTRVTGLRTETAAVPGTAAVPADTSRSDAPAATLPLLGGLMPSDVTNLPTRMPTSGDLHQLAQNTPLTHGGRYNTQAVTSTLTDAAVSALAPARSLTGSAATPLRK
jgi:hypothetical protein